MTRLHPNSRPLGGWALATAAVLAACSSDGQTPATDPNLYRVTREDLPITVKENGELVAVRETIVRSQVEVQSTIIYLIPEGTSVKEGDKLVELDVSELVEKRASQEISVERAKSAWEQARTQMDILEKELTTKRNTAMSQLKIAEMELEKLLGAKGGKGSAGKNADMVQRLRELVSPPAADPAAATPGAPAGPSLVAQVDPRNYAGLVDKVLRLLHVEGQADSLQRDMGEMANKILQQADQIRLAMADLKVKEDRVAHSRRLAAKNFITRNELESDELAYQSQASKVTIAWNDLELLINYTLQKDRIQFTQDFENAKLELERVDASNDAERKSSAFDVEAKQKEYVVAKERLDNWNKQIANATSYAPTPGLVVYARVDRDRRGGESIREGLQVRDRQELIVLPDNTKMRCIVKVQEAQIDKVVVGQAAHVSVEAFPNEILTGHVSRVAPVADSANSWMGNDKKVYTTVVDLEGENHDSRLRSRMAATATITIGTVKDVLTVPQQAVRRDRSVNYVWKYTEQGPQAVRVAAGQHNQEKVEITDGVVEGDIVYRTPPGGQPDPKFDQPALPQVAPAADVPPVPPPVAEAPGNGAQTNGAPTNGAPLNGAPSNGGESPRRREGNGGNRGAGGMAAMRKKFADMTPEELQQRREMILSMSERMRPTLDAERAAKFDQITADLVRAIDENRLDDAQTLSDSLRPLMPRPNRQGGAPGEANGGGNGGGGGTNSAERSEREVRRSDDGK